MIDLNNLELGDVVYGACPVARKVFKWTAVFVVTKEGLEETTRDIQFELEGMPGFHKPTGKCFKTLEKAQLYLDKLEVSLLKSSLRAQIASKVKLTEELEVVMKTIATSYKKLQEQGELGLQRTFEELETLEVYFDDGQVYMKLPLSYVADSIGETYNCINVMNKQIERIPNNTQVVL